MSYYDDWVDPNAFFKGGYKLGKGRPDYYAMNRKRKERQIEQEEMARNALDIKGIPYTYDEHGKAIIVEFNELRYRFFPGKKKWFDPKGIDSKFRKGDAEEFVKIIYKRHWK